MKLEMRQGEYERLLAECGFTDAEKDVLQLKRRGWANVDIAAELYCSSRTVGRRLHSIRRKMGGG